MSDRQKDLQEAMASGRIQDVTRMAKLVADGGAQLKAWTAEDCVSQRRSDVSDDELALRSGPGEGRFAPY